MPRNFLELILVRIVRLSVEGYSRREVANILGVSQECIDKILRRILDEKTDGWSNGQRQPFHLGSSSALGDDPPISEEVVGLEHCKQASACWLSV